MSRDIALGPILNFHTINDFNCYLPHSNVTMGPRVVIAPSTLTWNNRTRQAGTVNIACDAHL